MGEAPRRRRATVWLAVYIALFGADDEGEDSETVSTDQARKSTRGTSDGLEKT